MHYLQFNFQGSMQTTSLTMTLIFCRFCVTCGSFFVLISYCYHFWSVFFRLAQKHQLLKHCQCICTNRLYSTATDVIQPPHAEGEVKTYPPKIEKIVQDISQLSLLEVADLNELLKVSHSSSHFIHIDHDILLHRLKPVFGIQNSARSFF